MAASIQGQTQPWFTVNDSLSKAVLTSEEIDVSKITAVCFPVDVEILFGTDTEPFPLLEGQPIGIDSGVYIISIDVDTHMWAMGGK